MGKCCPISSCPQRPSKLRRHFVNGHWSAFKQHNTKSTKNQPKNSCKPTDFRQTLQFTCVITHWLSYFQTVHSRGVSLFSGHLSTEEHVNSHKVDGKLNHSSDSCDWVSDSKQLGTFKSVLCCIVILLLCMFYVLFVCVPCCFYPFFSFDFSEGSET